MKNPTFYGVENNQSKTIQLFLINLVDKTLRRLEEYGCIKIVDEQNLVEPTFMGYLASFYYIRHETIKHYSTSIKANSSIEELLKILCYSKEYEEVPMRHNEDNMNEALSKICPLKADLRKMDSANEKTFLLLQSHFFHLPVPIRDFVTDTKLVIDSSIRMIHAMVDFSAERRHLKTTLNIILIQQMIIQGVWFTDNPLINVPHFTNETLKQLKLKGISYLCELIHYFRREPDGLKDILFGQWRENNSSSWNDVQQALNQIPVLKCNAQLFGVDQEEMRKSENARVKLGAEAICSVWLNRTNSEFSQRVLAQKLSKVKDASWWVIVGDESEDRLLASKKVYFKKSIKKDLHVQLPNQGDKELKVYILSDSYLGIDQELRLQLS